MILSLFYAEFHPQQGPVILYDLPLSSKPKESGILQGWMDSISEFIIPKLELCGHVLMLLHENHLIMSCPITIQDLKYERNFMIFNMAFVFKSNVNSAPYESIVWKVAKFLERMEIDYSFLSKSENKKQLPALMRQIYNDLNLYGETFLSVDFKSHSFYLTNETVVTRQVADEDVPILISQVEVDSNMDISVQRVLVHINGFNHVKKISQLARVDADIVKTAVQHLLFYGCVVLVDVFKFTNIYAVLSGVKQLLSNTSLALKCSIFVSKVPDKYLASTATLFLLYNDFNQSVRVKDLVSKYLKYYENGIDIRKLVIFGCIHGFLKRVHEYPFAYEKSKFINKIPNDILDLLDGNNSLERIAIITENTETDLLIKIPTVPIMRR